MSTPIDARAEVAELIQQMRGYEVLHKALRALGDDGERLWRKLEPLAELRKRMAYNRATARRITAI